MLKDRHDLEAVTGDNEPSLEVGNIESMERSGMPDQRGMMTEVVELRVGGESKDEQKARMEGESDGEDE